MTTPERLDRRSALPLHHQLSSILRDEIEGGGWKPGSLIPSERELCQRFDVSNITVRRALRDLVQDGLIYRESGVGTFVAQALRRRCLALVAVGFRGESWRRRGRMFGDLIGGIGEVAWQRNARLTVTSLEHEQDLPTFLASASRDRNLDGLLIRPNRDLEPLHLAPPGGHSLPVVVIKRYHESRAWPCVVADDVRDAETVTMHLLRLGHRRIGAVLGPAGMRLFRDRRLGYERALAKFRVRLNPDWIVHAPDFQEADGAAAVRELLAARPRPTALLVTGETMATGVYTTIQEAGLVIPKDAAVVGFDESGETGDLRPAMTSIGVPYHEFGRVATRLLLDLLEGKAASETTVTLRAELTIRESSGDRIPLARSSRPKGGP